MPDLGGDPAPGAGGKGTGGGWGGIAVALLGAVSGCVQATARSPLVEPHPHPAGVLHIRWRTLVHQHSLYEAVPEECASGAIVGSRIVIGSRGSTITGVDLETGRIEWSTPTSGGIDGRAIFDPARGQVYVGADDGVLYALDPASGAVRWTHHAKGAIDQPPEIDSDAIYVATAADRVFSLDAATGKWRWQYERETPESFTIHGYAGPRLVQGQLLAGFSDGFLVSLNRSSGEVIWAKSLAAASDQFVDVDSTPAVAVDGTVFVSSYSGGLYALDGKNGSARFHLGIEGVGTVSLAGDRLFFAAAREGLHAVDRQGNVIWRQALTDAGDLTPPVVAGSTLIFSGSRAGLFIVNRDDGALLQVFNRGEGMCAAATLDLARRRLYILANGGSLYAMDLS